MAREAVLGAGHAADVGVLYEEIRDNVYRYLVASGIRAPAAQEFTQEAFLRLHAALLNGSTVANPRAWIFTVAHNLAVNSHRRPQESAPADDLDRIASATGDNPEARLLRAERLARVHRAFEDLSPQQRQCLSLRAEGFQYKEIAGITGLGVSTVGEFLRRAMVKLKEKLHD